MMKI